MLLAACHGNRIIEQYFIGDVGFSRDIGADRQKPRMEIGAIANILEHMLGWHKGRLPDPIRTFCAHMGVKRGRAIHP